MKILEKNRFILKKGDEIVGEAPSIQKVAELLGITRDHIYKQISADNMNFKFRKITYTIIDKLD